MAAHAVVIPFPEQGHINPLLQLSRRLASEHILVTFVNTEYTHSRMLRSGHQIAHSHIHFAQISDGLPLDLDRAANPAESAKAVQNMGGALEDLIRDLNREGRAPVSCIIASAFLPWTLHVAKKANLSWVVFWPQSLTLFLLYTHLSTILSNPRFPPRNAETVDYDIPGLPPLQMEDLPSHLQIGDLSCSMQQIIERALELIPEADCVIANSVEALESEASDACKARVRSVGPLFNPTTDAQMLSLWRESDCSAWLDSKPKSSVVYVSFGSMIRMSATQVHEIARGLLDSQQFFVWVLRPGIVEAADPQSEVLAEGLLERCRERGLVVPWAPQALVLSHPSVGGFFSHCGWNSTVESLSSGVPLLAFPRWYDQYTNRMLIVKQWKIGMKLNVFREDGIVEAEEIGRAVRALMASAEGEILRRRAAQLMESVVAASTDGGSSSKNLQSFAYGVAAEGERRAT